MNNIQSADASLQGTLEKVLFYNEENGFTVASLKVSSKETVTITGNLPAIHAGEYVTFQGSWSFHKKFGRQFQATDCQTQLPSTALGIQKYLGSGLIKGIGPKFAERLVNHFGEKTLDVINREPQKLSTVNGVGQKRVDLITKAWEDQKEISQVMVFLHGKEISTALAVKIYKAYGKDSLDIIQHNPYRLAEDIWGVGFKTADQLAIKLGLAKDSSERIKAGILHCLAEVVNSGHLYGEIEKLKINTYKLLELSSEEHKALMKNAFHELYRKDKIKLITHKEKHYISLPKYYFSEKGIEKRLKTLKEHPGIAQLFDPTSINEIVQKPDNHGIQLNNDQKKGIISCLQNKISIITGGPGTGKTTLVKKLLETLDAHHIKIRLAAPTGRAAKRIFEGTGRNAETLHRLLEFNPTIMNFTRNTENALDLDFLIIDEASMIDVFLMHSVVKALPTKAHLVLLGDIDQLPSVGAGNILRDLIDSQEIAVTKLTEIFRQAQDSMIIVNAHKVNNGEFPSAYNDNSRSVYAQGASPDTNDFIYIKEQEPENVFPLLRNIYARRLPDAGIKPEDSIVLTPMNRGIAGTQRLNQELQLILNPHIDEKKQVSRFGTVYKIGDRVMQIRNNYTKFVFNGDIGNITDINQENSILMIRFGDRILEYDFAELDEIMLSYAVSIHKSQGSEFQAVIIPIFIQHFILLQRNLLYTAITRAKKLCILVGEAKAISIAIRNNKSTKRITFLKEFLTSDLKAR